jgi:putative ABC transport system permease protein
MNPNWKQIVRERLAILRLPPEREIEIVEELALHLEAACEDALAAGLSEMEAEARAAQSYDWRLLECELSRAEGPSAARALQPSLELIERKGGIRMGSLIQDLRFGARMLLKQPGFTLIAALTLALGIGANTAIFSVINGVLLRPLDFRDPHRLFMLWTDNPIYQLGFHEFPAANTDLAEWRAAATSFEQFAAFQSSPADLSDGGDPERVGGVEVTANLLPLLGVQPLLGRNISAEEEQPGRDRVALISHALWRRRFGGDAEILGKAITVNGAPRTVIGIMPEGFHFPRATEMPQAYHLPERADLWTPLARDAGYWLNRNQRQLVLIVGRLKAGVTQAQAQAEMDGVAARQARAYPQTHGGWRVWLTPLYNQVVGQTRTPLLVLLGSVGFLLLIACVNIASLLLSRAAARRREMAVRAAIGSGRARIIRQLLTESLLLATLGGGLGLLFGYWGLNLLLGFIPPTVPRLQDISLDAHVLLFTSLISILTGALFGLVPAWQASKVNLTEALKDAGRANSAGRGVSGPSGHGLLVTAEVALVTILLIGAVLMLQSFRRLLAVDPGFKSEGVATFEVSLPVARYPDGGKRAQFFDRARAQLGSLPGVRAVGAISNLPLSGNESMDYFVVEGAEPAPRGKEPLAEDRVIIPGYFEAMGVSLISGRNFEATDGADKPPVAIVNETLARQFFPGGDAVGKRIKRVLGDKDWRTIVGVVRDVRGHALETRARPQLYRAHAQAPYGNMAMTARADATALPALRSAIQQEFKRLDATLPVANYRTMPELVEKATARPRFITLLLGLFAAIALMLTVVGLYGVVAYGVNQRTREIGIRVALGARRQNVMSLVIAQGARPAFVGVGVGTVGAFALMRLLTTQLYEIKPTDPATFGIVALGLLLVSLIACYIPARRATKVDPLTALRHE